MRIDKFLTECGVATRSEASKAARRGEISVNGAPIKDASSHINPEIDKVCYCGRHIHYSKYVYVMLNKPENCVSATEDGKDMTVLDLLDDELRKRGLFPCGRLDKNTVGLMLLTNNGTLSHRLLSPKHHVEKTYFFRSKYPLNDGNVERLESGVDIGGYVTAPCRVEMDSDRLSGRITLTEGKYHQIKLMIEAVGSKVTYLERITFGPLVLDRALERGEWRYLTDEEISQIENIGEQL